MIGGQVGRLKKADIIEQAKRQEQELHTKTAKQDRPKQAAAKFELLDTLELLAKYESGWSKWQGKTGLYVFKHLPESDKAAAPVAQVYKDRKYLSGVFKTKKPLEFSGDIKDRESGKRTFLIFNFESKSRMKIFSK